MLTLGLGVIVLNGAMVLLVAAIEPGLKVSSLLAGIVVALGVTIVNVAVTSLLAIDDDDFWYRNVARRQARRIGKQERTDVPGLFFIEIDGLAHDVLARAIRDGNASVMARWLREGSHRLTRWETDWSSQTGACQAGLLHGNNDDMPAFRWWEKDRGAPIVTNHPHDAMELERRHLGLVSFPHMPGRVTLEAPDERYPQVVPALRDHPGIGFLLVRSDLHGALAIGAGGVNYLDEERVEGDDPLAPFGANAARHVLRTDGFAHCPDIVVNSTYWAHLDEVAAFEELVGSHGGMGGTQSYPFVFHPIELALPDDEIVGAEQVHRELRRWLVELGHSEYAPAADPVKPPEMLRTDA